ncbi:MULTISPECIES: hypothetical protein [unclassified Xanthomonas]|uniref:hypothetical protein n=1 Tax=unclassified Xanthomonas TaxID=2643310 RepID=UPI002A7EBBE7|nr:MULTISPECIES: hypothetical protein [unclassified Xanthomonas]MDY4296842.1 hypothetical protein [Xanthomonas sp. LF02-5]MDY4358399.1 hypothetical protein [Xanthomonas sp. LF04-12]
MNLGRSELDEHIEALEAELPMLAARCATAEGVMLLLGLGQTYIAESAGPADREYVLARIGVLPPPPNARR